MIECVSHIMLCVCVSSLFLAWLSQNLKSYKERETPKEIRREEQTSTCDISKNSPVIKSNWLGGEGKAFSRSRTNVYLSI